MSKADRQTLVMLSVAASCFWQLHKVDEREDVVDLCLLAYSEFSTTVVNWPVEDTDMAKAFPMIEQWAEKMQEDPGRLNAKHLMYMAGRIIDDLSQKIRTPWKLDELKILSEFEEEVRKLIDEEGESFTDYEYADSLLDHLYNIVDWSW